MSCKSWFYTLNNYNATDIEFLERLEGITRHRCAKEVGESGTPHLQGIVCFRKTYRLAALKKLHDRIHWEPTKSVDHSINYCGKGEVIIDFNHSSKGMRTDIVKACEMIIEGSNMIEVATENPTIYVKYNRGLEKLKDLLTVIPDDFVTEVIIITGEPGTGKSRRAREIDPKLYSVREPNNKCGSLWFDGYKGEQTILFDDFTGWCSYSMMLKICDRYPMMVDIKGGTVQRRWNRVIITSNYKPELWWANEPNMVFKALKRRITQHIKM